MNWQNLKSNKCPKCGTYLTRAPFSSTASSTCGSCDFKISAEKLDKIVSDMHKPKIKRCATFEDNFEALQNLDREQLEQDAYGD